MHVQVSLLHCKAVCCQLWSATTAGAYLFLVDFALCAYLHARYALGHCADCHACATPIHPCCGRQHNFGLGAVPMVAEHPAHLPRLHLRRGAAQEAGQKAPSSTALADPGSEVSADTPGAVSWGQLAPQGQGQGHILGPGWALAQQYKLGQQHQQQSMAERQQQLHSLQRVLEQQQQQPPLQQKPAGQPHLLSQQKPAGQQHLLNQQKPSGQQHLINQQQLPEQQHLLTQQKPPDQQQSLNQQQRLNQQPLVGQVPSLEEQQSLGELQLHSLQQLMEQQQQHSLGLEQSEGWRHFLAQHQFVGLQPPQAQPHRFWTPPAMHSEFVHSCVFWHMHCSLIALCSNSFACLPCSSPSWHNALLMYNVCSVTSSRLSTSRSS